MKLDDALQAFKRAFGSRPRSELHCHFVPGRLEVLGKHTDYAGGRSLLAATSCGVVVVSALNRTDSVRVVNADPQFPAATFPLSAGLEVPIGPWTNYPMTVARRLARNFGGETRLRGVDIAFASDLPPASGMSSSSATIVASFFAVARPNRLAESSRYSRNVCNAEDLAMYLACNENGRGFRELDGDRGVGTFGGSEDHTAMLCCKTGMLSVYSFCPTNFERDVPFPDDLVFVVCHSGVFAEKTGEALAKYNAVSARARKACEAYNARYRTEHETIADIVRENMDGVAALLRSAKPGVLQDALRRSAATQGRQRLLDKFGAIPNSSAEPDALLDRFRQFVVESEYFIPRAAAALEQGDLPGFGNLVDQSHFNSRLMLWNIIPEIDFLQQSARKLGAIAASGFGAGFGGSAYAIVRAADTESFMARWKIAYDGRFPAHRDRAIWLTTRLAGAAREV